MSLRWYRRPRLVVLHPNASALEAARAMENNQIGAVVVQREGTVLGLVTDRDLAIKVTGQGLDPEETTLSEVMSKHPVTLPLSASREEAIELMRSKGIRRIPLLENGKLAGMVTFDDLLLDEAASLEELATVVESQIGTGGPTPSPRTPAAVRSQARAESTYRRLIAELQRETGLESFEQTETATRVVVSSLVRRLSHGEAQDFIAQLPSLMQDELRALPPGPDTSIGKGSIVTDLVHRLDIDPARAEDLLDVIGTWILGSISEGEALEVQDQLPEDLREVFAYRPPPAG